MRHLLKIAASLAVFFIIACYSNPERVEAPLEKKEKQAIQIETPLFPEKAAEQEQPATEKKLEKKIETPILAEKSGPVEVKEAEKEAIKRPGIPGLEFTDAVARVMKDELESFGGWRPNDLVFGNIWHNRKYEQLGKLEVVRHTVRVFKQDIARSGGMDKFDPNVALAEADFWNDPEKFWFPSAESKYKSGVQELLKYKECLQRGDTKFHPRSDNLYRLLDQYIAILGDVHHQLMRRDVGFFETDNIYFYSRGAASAMADILMAVETDFSEAIEGRGLTKLMGETIQPLKQAAGLKPLIVLSGDTDDLRANHRLNLAAYISEARTKLYAMIETLQK
jgi:hypothetical protein